MVSQLIVSSKNSQLIQKIELSDHTFSPIVVDLKIYYFTTQITGKFIQPPNSDKNARPVVKRREMLKQLNELKVLSVEQSDILAATHAQFYQT